MTEVNPAPRPVTNELHPELLASASWQLFPGHISASRLQMMGGHLSQALVIKGATARRCLTGVEREFGRATFSVKMPTDAKVMKMVEKFPTHRMDRQRIRENPLVTVLFESAQGEIGCIDIPRYHCLHQHFGFPYQRRQAGLGKLQSGYVPEGTILAGSPAIDEYGNSMLGVEANVAFLSVPSVIEDGVAISRSFLKKLESYGFESRDVSWGDKYYPLNLYGDEKEYKPFPDIGDRVRSDGLLFAMRRYDPLLGAVQMAPQALRDFDPTFDKPVYAIPGAKVIDVSVWHRQDGSIPPTPVGMETQVERYYTAQRKYYQELLAFYGEQRRQRRDGLHISKEFHRLLVEALCYLQDQNKQRFDPLFQLTPLDDWRVKVTFEYDVMPDVGYKITDFHGGKGVIVKVMDEEDMPLDDYGNRADIIVDPGSRIKRMIPSSLMEQKFNAHSWKITNDVRAMVADRSDESYQRAFDYLLGYYRLASPRMYDILTGSRYTEGPRYHVDSVLKDPLGVRMWLPTDNPVDYAAVLQELRTAYPVPVGPVTYRGASGKMVRTKKPVLIASMYMMLLEKTSTFDWSGVSSAKLQHFGIPAKPSKQDKYAQPGRPSPVRIMGESEVRLVTATSGGEVPADLLDMSNSPTTHQEVVANILRAEHPSNIDVILDRAKFPMGDGRSLVFVKHALECNGVEFYYTPESAAPPLVYRSEGEQPPIDISEFDEDDSE